MNYLGIFSSATEHVCKPLGRLTQVKVDWTWTNMYQKLYEKVKTTIKNDVLCNEKEPLYLLTDACSVGLVAVILKARDNLQFSQDGTSDNRVLLPMEFASKGLTSAETRYSNIEREALSTPHTLESLHHLCFSMR